MPPNTSKQAAMAERFPLSAAVGWGEPSSGSRALKHIPGHFGPPIVGQLRRSMFAPFELFDEYYRKYGPVFTMGTVMQRMVVVLGPDFIQELTLDPQQNYSLRMGYHDLAKDFLRGGLVMMDFDEHRFNRRIMQTAFKSSSMRNYVSQMTPLIEQQTSTWPSQGDGFLFHPAIKQLLLDISTRIFVGAELGEDVERLNQACRDMVDGGLAVIRRDWPGLLYHKAMNGMRTLDSALLEQVRQRRKADSGGQDMMSHLCQERAEDGELFDDAQVVDHMRLLLLAAHDTTTSALTMAAYELARHPEWQERLREEHRALGREALGYDDLDQLHATDWFFHETERLYPSVSGLSRRTVRDSELGGYHIPARTLLNTSIVYLHRMEEWWSEPQRFDPERFSPGRAEHQQHKFLWSPFGGGAHKCIGLHFAQLLFKCALCTLLRKYRLELPKGYPAQPAIQYMPLPKLRDNLPLRLRPIQ